MKVETLKHEAINSANKSQLQASRIIYGQLEVLMRFLNYRQVKLEAVLVRNTESW